MKAALLIGMILSAASGWQPEYSVEPLPQYDALFCREKGWTGADAAYSVALDDNVTLWLFGDTWIGDIIDGKHKNATMINNSVAIQRGTDPSSASVKFFWRTTKDGKPSAFVTPADGVGWFWIFDGIVAEGKLHLFLMQIVKSGEKGVFGFKHIGTWLGEVGNPQQDPLNWEPKQHKIPWGRFSEDGNLFFGSAVMRDKDYVYVYGAREDWATGMSGRSMIVARVRPHNVTDFEQWRFFSRDKWLPELHSISELFDGTATEYSVSYQAAIKKYVTIYTENGMSKNILMRFSRTQVGPWSKPYTVYECPECNWHKMYLCYAAKAHPEISEPDELIVTYVCNSTDFWQMAGDARIYRPRFLKIQFDSGSQ